MIIVKLQGGLGNQMFQYACGRAVSLKHSVPLYLDVAGFPDHNDRVYNLDMFNIKAQIATEELIIDLMYKETTLLDKLKTKVLFKTIKKSFSSKYFPEKEPCVYDCSIFNVEKDVYLHGYWQSEEYFKGISNILKEDFTLKNPLSKKSKEIADMICSSDSVSVHVRRGDYVSNPQTNKVHGTCDLSYYLKAVEIIASHVNNSHFYVFSDDPDWTKDNLQIDFPVTFINHNDVSKDYEALILMSLCKHQIIANSSFSWWGAWLNKNDKKTVVAPERWFAIEERNKKNDIVPATWTKT
jgi:hypothetical protein